MGYLIGSQDLMQLLWMRTVFKTNIRALFTFSAITIIITNSITVVNTKEMQFEEQTDSAIEKKNPFVKIYQGIRTMPKQMLLVCMVQFLVWIGWFTFFLYGTTWVGENVFGGNPDAPDGTPDNQLFDEGVRWGALGLTFEAGITLIYSPILPVLIKYFGVKPIYFFGQLVHFICLFLMFFVNNKIAAVILFAGCGIPWSTIMVIPFAIVSRIAGPSRSGLFLGVLNIFVVIPQLLVSATVGFIIEAYHNNVAIALLIGGIFAFLGAIMIFFLVIEKSENNKDGSQETYSLSGVH